MLPKLAETLGAMYEKMRRVLRGNKFNSSRVSQKTNCLNCSESLWTDHVRTLQYTILRIIRYLVKIKNDALLKSILYLRLCG